MVAIRGGWFYILDVQLRGHRIVPTIFLHMVKHVERLRIADNWKLGFLVKGDSINGIASLIEDYTSGYPFLVSKICLTIDEEKLGWTVEYITRVVQVLSEQKK